ncbi:MAG: helix-turn-helix transcriptional regulator [Pseudomonadota bacterium]
MEENQLLIVLGENIAKQRKRLNMSQKELAISLDISQQSLVRIEKGQMAPKMTRLQDVANHLQCPVSYLFKTDEELLSDRAKVMAHVLDDLPVEAQEMIVDAVSIMAKVMRG